MKYAVVDVLLCHNVKEKLKKRVRKAPEKKRNKIVSNKDIEKVKKFQL
jgi:hypothetical protein